METKTVSPYSLNKTDEMKKCENDSCMVYGDKRTCGMWTTLRYESTPICARCAREGFSIIPEYQVVKHLSQLPQILKKTSRHGQYEIIDPWQFQTVEQAEARVVELMSE